MTSGAGDGLTVLLVANSFSWAIGQIAEDLVAAVGDRITFLYFSTGSLRRDPAAVEELDRLLDVVDVVHVLDPYAYRYLPEFPTRRPTIAPVYHVLRWEDEEPNISGDLIFTICDEWADHLIGRGLDPAQVGTLTLGVDTTFWHASRERRSAGSGFRLGFFAHADAYTAHRKGVTTLVSALAMHQATVPSGDTTTLVLTGTSWQWALDDLRETGVEVQWERYVSRSRLRRLYRSLDAYVIASSVEGGPATVLEAMACGVPCITTPVGITREVVEDDVNGLVTPAGDAVALAKAIAAMRDPRVRERLAAPTRAAALAFDARSTYADVGELYGRAIVRAERRGARPGSTGYHDASAATQRAAVAAEDRIQDLMFREHPPNAMTDLIAPVRRLVLAREWRTVADVASRLVKAEAVSYVPFLRRMARRRQL